MPIPVVPPVMKTAFIEKSFESQNNTIFREGSLEMPQIVIADFQGIILDENLLGLYIC